MATSLTDLYGGERRVYLIGTQENGEKYEIGPVTVRDTLTGLSARETPCGFEFPMRYTMSFDLKPMKRKQWLPLYQHLGIIRSPKTTYKTIKRNCAKRNK